MEIEEALRKAEQILQEESFRPTTMYWAAGKGSESANAVATVLQNELFKRRPFAVRENPADFRFVGTNYDLILRLYSLVAEHDRPGFVKALLSGAGLGLFRQNLALAVMRLITHFCVAIGYKTAVIDTMEKCELNEEQQFRLTILEEMLSLQFNLFSDGELLRIRDVVLQLLERAEKERQAKPDRALNEITMSCTCLFAECEQARYFYLKGALMDNANLEVNQDKARVENYLATLGFPAPLLESLNVAEQDYRASATPFELKNCLGHLRSFLEKLHEQACISIAAKANAQAPKRWRASTEMLVNKGILSRREESLAVSLYSLLSDEGVHPLMAEREYARLLRNMVIEYGLMFLAKLKQSGAAVASD